MTVKGFTDQGSTTADKLFAGEFPVVSELVTITGGKYSRGAILGQNTTSGKYTICVPTAENGTPDGTETPCAILAEDADASTDDVQAVVYLTGVFNATALTAGTGNTVAGLKGKLREKSIFLKTNQAY